MSQAQVQSPLDPTGLGKAVQVALVADIAVNAASSVLSSLELAYLADFDPSMNIADRFSPYMAFSDGLIPVQLAVWLTAAVLTAKYIYRASRNAHAVAGRLSDSPGWAIGWYFVPIANLWMPFRAFKEAWLANETPGEWRSRPTPPILRLWWGLWLLSSLVPMAMIFAEFRQGPTLLEVMTVGDLMRTDFSALVTSLITIALDMVFIEIVRRLTPIQMKSPRWEIFD